MRVIGVLLILLGCIGFLLIGTVSSAPPKTVATTRPAVVEQPEQQTIPFTPVASGIVLAFGFGLVAADVRPEG